MTKPDELVEGVAKEIYRSSVVQGTYNDFPWERLDSPDKGQFIDNAKYAVRFVLAEIQRGNITTTTEVIENGIRFNKVILQPDYQRFLEGV